MLRLSTSSFGWLVMSLWDNAQATHSVAQQKMGEWISPKFTPWKVSNKVWLEMTNLHMGGPNKLQMKWTSPFAVEEVLSRTAYCLWIPSCWKTHPVFHASLLTTYQETMEHGPNFLQPPPDFVDGEDEYEVGSVLGHHRKLGHHTFLIWWKGYSTVEDTWEPKHNLGNAQPLLVVYKIAHPDDFLEYNHHYPTWKKPWRWAPHCSPSSSLSFLSWFSQPGSPTSFGIFSTWTWGSPLVSLDREESLSHLKYRAPLPTGRRCEGSLIPALPQWAGKDIRHTWCLLHPNNVLHPHHPHCWNSPPPLLPFSFSERNPCQPCPIHLCLSRALAWSPVFHTNPLFTQLVRLYCNYALIC